MSKEQIRFRILDLYNRGGIPRLGCDTTTQALQTTSQTFEDTDGVCISASRGLIGDTVITTAYMRGVKEALKTTGRSDVPVFTLTTANMTNLLGGLKEEEGINVHQVRLQTGMIGAPSFLSDRGVKNGLHLDFDANIDKEPSITVTPTNWGKTINVNNLLMSALWAYPYNIDGPARYARFIKDLFSLPSDLDQQKVQPYLPLPKNWSENYNWLCRRFEIDQNRRQVSFVVEASTSAKKYPMSGWAALMRDILIKFPDTQISIIHNPKDPLSLPTKILEQDLRSALQRLDANACLEKCRLVFGTLEQMATYISRSDLVVSNDTGLGHIAGAIKGGPPAVIIFQDQNYPPKFWVSSSRQTDVSITEGNGETLVKEAVFGKMGQISPVLPVAA